MSKNEKMSQRLGENTYKKTYLIKDWCPKYANSSQQKLKKQKTKNLMGQRP